MIPKCLNILIQIQIFNMSDKFGLSFQYLMSLRQPYPISLWWVDQNIDTLQRAKSLKQKLGKFDELSLKPTKNYNEETFINDVMQLEGGRKPSLDSSMGWALAWLKEFFRGICLLLMSRMVWTGPLACLVLSTVCMWIRVRVFGLEYWSQSIAYYQFNEGVDKS